MKGPNWGPWASLAKVACFKELYNGRSLFGAKGKGLRLGLVPCLPSSGSHLTGTRFHVKLFSIFFRGVISSPVARSPKGRALNRLASVVRNLALPALV